MTAARMTSDLRGGTDPPEGGSVVLKSKKLKPLWIAAAILSVDRFFALGALQDYTIGPHDVDYVSYQQAPLVLEAMQNSAKSGRKTAFILGSSRSNAFGSANREFETYNFSAAMACPSHYAYWLERASRVIRPDLVLVETDPLQLSTAVVESSLAYSYDARYVLTKTRPEQEAWPAAASFTFREGSRFLQKRILFVDRFPGAPMNAWQNLVSRMKGDDAPARNRAARRLLESYAREHRGIIPADQFRATATDEELAIDTKRFEKYMMSYSLSSTQTGFLLALLRYCEQEKIPVLLYRALAARPYREAQARYGLEKPMTTLREIAAHMKYVRYVDPSESKDIRCRQFMDALHLRGACIAEQDAYLFAEGAAFLRALSFERQ